VRRGDAVSDIIFNIYQPEDPFHRETSRPETIILHGSWMDFEGEGVNIAARVCEDWFDDNTWSQYFGDDIEAAALVEIIEPVINAGFYEVSMTRRVTATAIKTEDPRS
jgi:hypothetical protein